jgi:hypothetical protein
VRERVVVLVASAIILLVFCSPSYAHHGAAAYDRSRTVTLKGTVTDFRWANPHVQIYLDVKDDKGDVQRWGCESVNPGMLARQGWTRNMMKPGDQITIVGTPTKSGSPVCLLNKLTLANGQEFGAKLIN